jgi:hypothetical protein
VKNPGSKPGSIEKKPGKQSEKEVSRGLQRNVHGPDERTLECIRQGRFPSHPVWQSSERAGNSTGYLITRQPGTSNAAQATNPALCYKHAQNQPLGPARG